MVVIPVGIAFFNEAMTTVAGWMFFNLRKVTTKHFFSNRKIPGSNLTKNKLFYYQKGFSEKFSLGSEVSWFESYQ